MRRAQPVIRQLFGKFRCVKKKKLRQLANATLEGKGEEREACCDSVPAQSGEKRRKARPMPAKLDASLSDVCDGGEKRKKTPHPQKKKTHKKKKKKKKTTPPPPPPPPKEKKKPSFPSNQQQLSYWGGERGPVCTRIITLSIAPLPWKKEKRGKVGGLCRDHV